MVMTCIAALIAAASIGTALFGGIVSPGASAELLSIMLAGVTTIAVFSASAMDS